MSCCGQGRQAYGGVASSRTAASTSLTAIFEYVGPTSMMVRGPATGNTYRFTARGMRLRVDARDRVHLLGIPHLRMVM